MHIVIDAEPDPAVWRAAFRELLRRPVRRLRIVGALFALAGLLFIVADSGSGGLLLIGAMLLVIGLLYAIVIPMRSLRASMARLAPAAQQPKRIELTEQSVRVTSPLVFSEYAWAAFTQLKEVPGVLMLMPTRNQVVPVPIGGLNPAELAQLREFVANRQFVHQ